VSYNELIEQNAEGQMHDPITYKVFSPHIHIVFLKTTVS
jgi:peptidyl-prolyl cis-trans isomerase-like protein 2